jgi:hypothetical protein
MTNYVWAVLYWVLCALTFFVVARVVVVWAIRRHADRLADGTTAWESKHDGAEERLVDVALARADHASGHLNK